MQNTTYIHCDDTHAHKRNTN